MERIKRFVQEHKRGSLIALFLLIVFVGFSITSAMSVADRRTHEAEKAAADTHPAQAGQPKPPENAALTENQKALIEGYDEKTKEIISTLSSSVWSAADGKYTLRFFDTYYTETVNGQDQSHPYAISAVESDNDGAEAKVYTLALETETGTHLVTFVQTVSADAESPSSLSSKDLFSLSGSAYTRKEAVEQIEIQGMEEEFAKTFGQMDNFKTQFSNWLSVHYPAAKTAVWTKNATTDYEKGLVVTAFRLNSEDQQAGSQSPVVSVTFNKADGTYQFEI